MEDQIKKQCGFKQSLQNEAALGAYYTDLEHCRWIRNLLDFPEDREVCCIDPSIGDASAILTITGKNKNRDNIKVFGVELNRDTWEEVMENKEIEDCLATDFLTGVLISHKAFSFAFVNPPYGELEKSRKETLFLAKLKPYLTNNAVVVYVLPENVCRDLSFLKQWCGAFDTKFLYRFHRDEYEKWKQVVIIGTFRKAGNTGQELERVLKMVSNEETIAELPAFYEGEKVKVMPSGPNNITTYTTREFDAIRARKCLSKSPLREVIEKKLKVPKYVVDDLGRPIITPSDGQMYLLAVSGGGQGLVGSEENGDLHLQRGVVKVEEKSEYRNNEKGKMTEVVTQYSQISYKLVENSGRITTLS